MAIRKPNLDELDVTLDAFVGSFDSDSDLLKADATLTNLTLDELDAFVSNFDALDTFGNVDTNYSFSIKNMSADVTAAVTIQAELAFSIPFDASASLAVTATADAKRVKDFAASASVAATATATSLRQRLADASVSAVATATNDFNRIRSVEADVTGAASIAAVAAFIARMTVNEPFNVTGTASYGLTRPATATASAALTGTGVITAVRGMEADVSVSITDSVSAIGIFKYDGAKTLTVTATLDGEILGEKWSTVDDENETWTDVAAGSEVWTTVSKGSEVWLTQ